MGRNYSFIKFFSESIPIDSRLKRILVSKSFRVTTTFVLLLLLAGCAAGPKYQRPTVVTPPTWSTEAPWRAAEPRDGIPKGAWWTLYQDSVLDQLEIKSLNANQSIQLAVTRVEQARDLARVQVAGVFPSLTVQPSALRERLSASRPATGRPGRAGPDPAGPRPRPTSRRSRGSAGVCASIRAMPARTGRTTPARPSVMPA